MPSSTSDSKSTAISCAKTLVGITALLIIALEISSAYLLKHKSVTYARISRQYEGALEMRPAQPGAPPSVLMWAISLFLHAVHWDRFRPWTSSGLRLSPFFL